MGMRALLGDWRIIVIVSLIPLLASILPQPFSYIFVRLTMFGMFLVLAFTAWRVKKYEEGLKLVITEYKKDKKNEGTANSSGRNAI